ncbi:AlbA family DNA-binding domain-containing protein [Microbulbifer spongiae]|uniref:ATP-binding protein n=1 Tax=Microbulbifer spongiae TaxID=2944933 RepID=A0ABY9E5B4_9GAMM|nr:ATP-binding protein [Microbulbifer sp. MI-G]WKD48208.1 ATP-binding protein [Microbulbifer sp. MI-G]
MASSLELQIQKLNEDTLISNIQLVFDEIIKVVEYSGKTFNSLLFESRQAKIARYFQIVFYAFYKLLITEDKEIVNKAQLVSLLNRAGDKTINLAAGGGNWSAKEKQMQSDALYGVIHSCFEESSRKDPARNHWVTRFENILMQSSTEQALYDFKIGLHPLIEGKKVFSNVTFSKIVKTLTSMANTFCGAIGYCLIGVADDKRSADRFCKIYGEKYIQYSSFYITGVNSEAGNSHGDLDSYFTELVQLIQKEPISDRNKDNLSRNITNVKYFDKDIIVMKIESDNKPSIYDGKYYVRHGSSVDEVRPENFNDLFSRFQR